MLKSNLANDNVYKHIQKYMIDIIAKQKHSSMLKMKKCLWHTACVENGCEV